MIWRARLPGALSGDRTVSSAFESGPALGLALSSPLSQVSPTFSGPLSRAVGELDRKRIQVQLAFDWSIQFDLLSLDRVRECVPLKCAMETRGRERERADPCGGRPA